MFFVFTHIFSNTYSVLHILVFSSVLHTSFTDRFRVIFVQVFPCISLVILNILLFSAMRRAEQRRRRLTINRTNNNLKKNNAAKQKRGTVGRYNDTYNPPQNEGATLSACVSADKPIYLFHIQTAVNVRLQ